MAQEFSSKEAKSVLERHQALSKTLDDLASCQDAVKRNAEKTARSLQSRGWFKNASHDELTRGAPVAQPQNE